MRFRYILAVWVLGALLMGFSLGEMMERDLYNAGKNQPRIHAKHNIAVGDDRSSEDPNEMLSRC